jgi:hypothetical protein
MSDSTEQPDPQLENLLRRWGVDEADRQAHPAPLRLAPPEPAKPAAVWRWVPLAAALVLFAGTAGLFVMSRTERPPVPTPDNTEAEQKFAALQGRLDTVEVDLKHARTDLKLARDRLRDREQELKAEMAAELARFEAEKTAATDRLRTSLGEKEVALERVRARLDAAEKAQDKLTNDLAEVRRERAELAQRLEAQVKELAGRLEAERKARGAAETRLAAAEKRLDRLVAAAVGGPDAAGWQRAAKERRLVERGAELQKAVTNEETRRLLGRLEVALTRLQLLDPNDADQVDGFRRFIRRSDLFGAMAKVRSAEPPDSALGAWLWETRMALMGV